MTIAIAMVDIMVSKENHDFSERELQIIEVLLLNLAAHANSHATGQDMAINPLEKTEDHLLHFQFAWQRSIPEEDYENFAQSITNRYNTAFKMTDIEDVSIQFRENAYLNN